jgi:class 3 adenylate cyclase
VTFLFTDIEGSSRLWEEHPEQMGEAVARHDQIVVDSIARHAGTVVKTRGEGDSAFAVFARASDAIGAAVELQQALAVESWPAGVVLRVRAALHTGEAELRQGDYFGGAVNRCARLRAIANGGQTLVSEVTAGIPGSLAGRGRPGGPGQPPLPRSGLPRTGLPADRTGAAGR